MSISVGALSSAQTYSPIFQSRSAGASDESAETDPLTALLQAVSAPANQTAASPASAPTAAVNGVRFNSGAMGSLLSAQGHSGGGGGAAAGAAPGAGGDDSSSDAQGATTITTVNADGTTTTTTTYADGTTETSTTPASSSAASKGDAAQDTATAAGGQSDADQLLKLISSGLQALAPAAALLAVI